MVEINLCRHLATADSCQKTVTQAFSKDQNRAPHSELSLVSISLYLPYLSCLSYEKKFIGPIEFIISRTTTCICHFFCIEHLYGRFP